MFVEKLAVSSSLQAQAIFTCAQSADHQTLCSMCVSCGVRALRARLGCRLCALFSPKGAPGEERLRAEEHWTCGLIRVVAASFLSALFSLLCWTTPRTVTTDSHPSLPTARSTGLSNPARLRPSQVIPTSPATTARRRTQKHRSLNVLRFCALPSFFRARTQASQAKPSLTHAPRLHEHSAHF